MITIRPLYRNQHQRFGEIDPTMGTPIDYGDLIFDTRALDLSTSQQGWDVPKQTNWAKDVGSIIGAGADWVLANQDAAMQLYYKITGKTPPLPPPPAGNGTGFKIDTAFIVVAGLVFFLLVSQPWRKD